MKRVNKLKQAALILDGEINLKFIEEDWDLPLFDLICCTDGAYLTLKNSQIIHHNLNAIIGDLDSLGDSSNIDKKIEIIHKKDQNSTDFEKALNYLFDKGIKKIIVYGASGLSSDHFLGNISTAIAWKNKIDLEFRDAYGSLYFIDKNFEISGVKGKTISLIPFFEATDVYYEGLMYPLNGETLSFGQKIGTRNIAVEDSIKISYGSGCLLFYIENKRSKRG